MYRVFLFDINKKCGKQISIRNICGLKKETQLVENKQKDKKSKKVKFLYKISIFFTKKKI